MNDNQLTTKDMFEILRSDISDFKTQVASDISDLKTQVASDILEVKTQVASDILEVKTQVASDILEVKTQVASDISEVKTEILGVRSDIRALDDRLRRVEETVAGTKAVATYQRQLVDWLFRIAAVIGVGGALKAFLS